MINPKPDGMYAMAIDEHLQPKVLGGPFDDIDDVLDACFGELMRTDSGRDTVFYVEVCGGRASVRTFPEGAFPSESEFEQA